MLHNLAGFLLGQEDHFFSVLNLTSGIMINYYILFTFLWSINIWWQLETGYWVLTFLTYFSLSVQSPLIFPGWCTIFLCSGYWQLYSGMKKFPLPLGSQGCRSSFRSQLLRAHGTCKPSLPLTTSLSFGHASPAARSPAASRHQRWGRGHACVWLGNVAPLAVTKTTEVMAEK